jgi:DNA-binding NarL/FixJ family response regulator
MEPLCHLFALSSAADGWRDLPRATDGLTVLCDFSRGVSQQARQVMQVRRDITVLGLVAPSDAATAMECIEAGARGSLLLRLGGCTLSRGHRARQSGPLGRRGRRGAPPGPA